MGVRWRQYELIFAFALFLLLLSKSIFSISFILPLAMLAIINIWLLPRYLYTKKQLLVLPAAAILYWLALSTAFTTTSFFYKTYYSATTFTADTLWQKSIERGLANASLTTIIYLLYCFLREPIIQSVMKEHAKRPFRIMLCNRIIATAFIYSGVLLFGIIFRFRSDTFAIFYIFILLPVIIIIFINVYGLFPYMDKMREPLKRFWYILFIAPILFSAISVTIFSILRRDLIWQTFPILAFIMVVLATPISWLLYIQQKDKLGVLLQLKKELGKTTADLAFLRSQINPHFLFNTLNTLYGTALQENAGRTAEGVQRLGDMMRFLLHENHRQQIPLKRELEYLNNYIALQQLRIATSKDISIQTDIGSCSYDHLIAPMLLIPFVENAYKHGIRLTTPSFIKIHFYCVENGIYLDVTNSIHPKRIQEGMPQQGGVGLQNVKERLQLIYPGKHTLHIQEDDTAFTIHLNIQLIN